VRLLSFGATIFVLCRLGIIARATFRAHKLQGGDEDEEPMMESKARSHDNKSFGVCVDADETAAPPQARGTPG